MAHDLMNSSNSWLDFGNFGDDFFDHFGRNLFKNGLGFPTSNRQMTMKTDISESDTAYSLKIDLPGLKKNNIQIDYENGILTVSGKQEHENTAKNDEGEIIHSERYLGSCSRSYSLPNVDKAGVTATYDGGVLSMTLPKLKAEKSDSRIEIQ